MPSLPKPVFISAAASFQLDLHRECRRCWRIDINPSSDAGNNLIPTLPYRLALTAYNFHRTFLLLFLMPPKSKNSCVLALPIPCCFLTSHSPRSSTAKKAARHQQLYVTFLFTLLPLANYSFRTSSDLDRYFTPSKVVNC